MDKKKILVISVAVLALITIIIGVIAISSCGKDSDKRDEENTKVVENNEVTESTDEKPQESASETDESTSENPSENEDSTTETVEQTESTTSTDDMDSESSNNNGHQNSVGGSDSNAESVVDNEKETEEETTNPPSSNDDSNVNIQPGMTTMQVVKDMGIGINLGNTFESCGDWINSSSVTNYETGWGSPVITEDMIKGMANEGFKTLRVPVAWSNMMAADYTINPAYMARVKEVVDWALKYDMYVIMNIHWDGGWWENFPTQKDECMKKYKSIWTQISNEFRDYDEKLVFESLNEEGCWDSVWNRYGGATSSKKTAFDLLNEINQTFVNLVRASGGNNANRHLLIAGYATDITLTCDSYFKMPEDSAGRCAVSVHYYTPSTYTILDANADWGEAKIEWGSASDIAELNKYMKMMYDNFVSKGVPVIIGEFGLPAMKNKTKENAILYLSSVAKAAYDYGMCPVLWDTTSSYSYYNRYTCSMSEYQSLKEAFLEIVE